MVSRSFGCGRVSDRQIGGLRDAQREAIGAIIVDLEAEVDRKVKLMGDSLEKTSKTFVADMTRDIQNGLAKLREDIRNREESIRQIGSAREAVQQALAAL